MCSAEFHCLRPRTCFLQFAECTVQHLSLIHIFANGGKGVSPKLIDKITFSSGIPANLELGKDSKRLLSEETAQALDKMLSYNVSYTYGEENFPGLELRAKSGTAEVGEDREPHAWFTGYIKNDDYPLAFVVIVENGGWGSSVAGSVANTVLQAAVGNN